MSKIKIRLASREDMPLLHKLLRELAEALGKSHEIKSTVQNLLDFGFGEQPQFETMLAFEADHAVGFAIFFPEFSTWLGTPGVYIQDLYVARELRGSGLGRDLLKSVQEHAGKWGSRYMKLSVYDGNQKAVAFYQHLGFDLREDENTLVLKSPL